MKRRNWNAAAYLVCIACFAIAIWLTDPHQAYAQAPLTPIQITALNLALDAGEHWHDGIELAAIVWAESSLCLHMHAIHSSAQGCAQLHPDTAAMIAGVPVSNWSLEHDWSLNMRIAAAFLRKCMDRFGYRGGIRCYRLGIPAASNPVWSNDDRHYVAKVLRHVWTIEHLPIDEN
ncbi:MAG: lytic transglycosylase domain-containing protein [Gammaproteobacteria bacterium]